MMESSVDNSLPEMKSVMKVGDRAPYRCAGLTAGAALQSEAFWEVKSSCAQYLYENMPN